MLNGVELGQAIARAIELKIASGAIKSKSEIALHFGIKTPSIYDWINKGSISKEKLPELWRYFSDVVGPEHWGLGDWPSGLLGDKSSVAKTEEGRAFVLTARQQALLDLFDGLTEAQQVEAIRNLQATKQQNDAIIEELSRRRKRA
ncbi:Phage repressor protein [Gammaproteobacteria bacterium]